MRAIGGHWEIAWGPTTFSAAPGFLADAAMYVARRRRCPGGEGPGQVVVVVGGTNPISLFDWVFGDFTVLRQVPWAYGRPADANGARISFSTALGLSILQHMCFEIVWIIRQLAQARGRFVEAATPPPARTPS